MLLNVAKGTANEFDKKRLASYGIDEKTAKLIADMPYERNGWIILANAKCMGY